MECGIFLRDRHLDVGHGRKQNWVGEVKLRYIWQRLGQLCEDLEQILPLRVSGIVPVQMNIHSLPSVTDVAALGRHDFRHRGPQQLRLALKQLSAGGCLLTSVPAARLGVFLRREGVRAILCVHHTYHLVPISALVICWTHVGIFWRHSSTRDLSWCN